MNTSTSLPQSENIEKCVISTMLKNCDETPTIPRICALGITPEHFYHPDRSKLFSLILERNKQGLGLDIESLAEAVMGSFNMDLQQAINFIYDLSYYHPTTQNIVEHCKILVEKLAKRKAIIHAQEISRKVNSGEANAEDIQSLLRVASEDLCDTVQISDRTDNSKEAAKLFYNDFTEKYKNGGIMGTETKIREIDEVTGGLRPQDLWSIAAYPSCGKSTLMLQIAYNAAAQGKRVVVFSLEMSNSDLVAGLISYSQQVDASTMFNPKTISKGETQKIQRGVQQITQLDITFCDKANLSMDVIESECERLGNEKPIDLIVVDYWQIISSTKQTKIEALEDNSHRLKQLAKFTKATVITGSQLNDDGKLKGSRKLGEDSKVTLVLPKDDNDGVLVAKNRNGQRNVYLNLELNGRLRRFQPTTNQ